MLHPFFDAMLRRILPGLAALIGCAIVSSAQAQVVWQGYAKDAQHTAQSGVRSQALGTIVWQTPVDLQPQYQGNNLFIHYGSPVITSANTVIVPVKTGVDDGFELQARSGADGTLLWTQTTDYTLPPHGWTPSYSPTLTPQGRIYWAGAGGNLFYRSGDGADVEGSEADDGVVLEDFDAVLRDRSDAAPELLHIVAENARG